MHSFAKSLALGLVAAAALAASNSAQANLVLTLNTVDKTYSLSGSDTGTFVDSLLYYEASWILVPGGTGGVVQQLSLSSGGSSTWFSLNPGPIGSAINSFLTVGGGTNVIALNLIVDLSETANQTVSGLGTTLSYAGLSANNQILLENAIGQSMPFADGGAGPSFAPISVVAVPEPSTFALLGLAGLGLLRRRR